MFSFFKLLKSHHLPLVAKQPEAQNAYTFYFEKQGLTYQAGQHFVCHLTHENADQRGSVRIFSASSAPHEPYLAFTTRYFGEQSSSFKRALMSMKPGQTISVRGPSPLGDVYKIKDYSKPRVYLAGGVGITPFRSILLDTLHRQTDMRGALFYCNRDQDFIFGSDIEAGVAGLPNFEWRKVLSPERVSTEDLRQVYQRLGQETIFIISGTIKYVEYYENLLKNELQLSKNQIKAYKYRGLFGSYT